MSSAFEAHGGPRAHSRQRSDKKTHRGEKRYKKSGHADASNYEVIIEWSCSGRVQSGTTRHCTNRENGGQKRRSFNSRLTVRPNESRTFLTFFNASLESSLSAMSVAHNQVHEFQSLPDSRRLTHFHPPHSLPATRSGHCLENKASFRATPHVSNRVTVKVSSNAAATTTAS